MFQLALEWSFDERGFFKSIRARCGAVSGALMVFRVLSLMLCTIFVFRLGSAVPFLQENLLLDG